MRRKREGLILLLIVALVAVLLRLAPWESRPETREGATMWGIRLGMNETEATAAFGREPLLRRTVNGHATLVYGREFGAEDAVATLDDTHHVVFLRGSAVEVAGKRVYLPLEPRQVARLFGECVTVGDQQRYYPALGVGFQYRTVVLVPDGGLTSQSPMYVTHATSAWIGPRDAGTSASADQLSYAR